MSHKIRCCLCTVLVGLLALGGIPGLGLTREAITGWDITRPRGRTRVIDFTTSEGTWMSVDVSPDGRWLVFDLLGHIYRLPAKGGPAVCLTQDSGMALNFHPRYSPDGRLISFVSDRAGQNNLWVMEADGSNPRPVFLDANSRITEPTWMPDGKHIIAVRNIPTSLGMWRRSARLWMFPLDGGAAVELLGAPGSQFYWPSVSPDGRHVYFHVSTTARPQDGVQEHQHIRRLDLDTKRIEVVTEPDGDRVYRASGPVEVAPEISPDGRWLAFARRVPGGTISYRGHRYRGRTALWLRDLWTGAERVIMDPITTDMTAAHGMKNLRVVPGYSWARDGKSIVLSQGGKLRRLRLASGKVDTIPFTARVHRIISQAARARINIPDAAFSVRFVRWPTASPDGKHLVFEAVGQIWIMDAPNWIPRPLVRTAVPGFQLSPAWSPDGRWIAFTTWDDEEGGRLWKVSPEGDTPERLTSQAAEYLNPVWSPDGQVLIVTRGSGATVRGQTMVHNTWYDLVRVPASGGTAELVARMNPPGSGLGRGWRRIAKAAFGPGGRIYYPEQQQQGGSTFVTLVSINPAGDDRREHLIFSYADDVVPSPDGGWVAFHEGQNIYLAPFDWKQRGEPIRIRKTDTRLPVKRLSWEGGLFPHWRGASTLEFSSGNRYFVHHVDSGRTESLTIQLRLPRDIPRGTIALTGARIITLDHREVIKRGTVLVKGSRIVCVGDCGASAADAVLDVSGKTIIPGFVDVHAHHLSEHDGVIPQHSFRSALYLAYGVTTTLDPAPVPETAFPTAELIEAGKLVGPRTFSTGDIQRSWGDRDEITSPERAEQNIRRLAAWGAISIKDFLLSRRDQRQWLADAARKRGLTITAEGADLFYNLSLIMDGHTGWEHSMMYLPLYRDAAKFFAQAKAVYSPTLIVGGDGPWALEYFLARSDLWHNPKQRRFVPWTVLMRARNSTRRPLEAYSFPIIAEGVADVVRAGGYAAIGGHGEHDGIGSHWEVWIYASALTPIEALELASLGGAYFLGLEHDLGSITVGKLADLMVLNSNPLDDIHNTLNIEYVMKAGRLYQADTLDEMWPETKPYGRLPWINGVGLRSDDRSVSYWEQR